MSKGQTLIKITFILIFLFSFFISFSQSKINYSLDQFNDQIKSEFKLLGIENSETEILSSTINNWKQSFSDEDKKKFIEILNFLSSSNTKNYLAFLYYSDWILNNLDSKSSFADVLLYHYYFIYSTDKPARYFQLLWEKINNKY